VIKVIDERLLNPSAKADGNYAEQLLKKRFYEIGSCLAFNIAVTLWRTAKNI